jgi:hypothetical protein
LKRRKNDTSIIWATHLLSPTRLFSNLCEHKSTHDMPVRDLRLKFGRKKIIRQLNHTIIGLLRLVAALQILFNMSPAYTAEYVREGLLLPIDSFCTHMHQHIFKLPFDLVELKNWGHDADIYLLCAGYGLSSKERIQQN